MRRAPRRVSNSVRWRDTPALDMRKASAALTKLPASTTAVNTRISSNRSILTTKLEQCVHEWAVYLEAMRNYSKALLAGPIPAYLHHGLRSCKLSLLFLYRTAHQLSQSNRALPAPCWQSLAGSCPGHRPSWWCRRIG